MNLSRRELLTLLAMASATSLSGCSLGPPARRKNQVLLSGAYDATAPKNPRLALAVQAVDGNLLHLIPTTIAAHSIIQSPRAPAEFIFFPQGGRTAALLRLADGKPALQEFKATDGWGFYGHGAYALDGASFYSVETQEYRGKIVLRNLENFSVTDEWHLPGVGAHDCQLSRDGKLLFVAMDGLQPTGPVTESSLLQLHLETGVITQHSVSPRGLALGHFAISSTGTIAGAMTIKGENEGSLAWALPGGDFQELRSREVAPGLEEQTLSVALHEGLSVIGGVCPKSNTARFWDARSGAFLGQRRLAHPVGISAIPRGFAVTSHDGISQIEGRTLQLTTVARELAGLSYLAHHLTCDQIA